MGKRQKFGRKMAAVAVAGGAIFVAACSSSASSSGTASSPAAGSSSASAGSATAVTGTAAGAGTSVAYLVPGALGDLGIFDSGQKCISQLQSADDSTKTVQGGPNATSTWVSDLTDLSSSGSWKVIVTGASQIDQPLQQVAKQFPNQKYIMFDDVVNGPNIANITFRQNDGAYMAGVLAGLVADDPADFPKDAGASKTVGIVGALDVPVIQDFVVGFRAGVKAVNPSIQILTSYVGSVNDPQTAYNQATDMFHRGAAVVYGPAANSTPGVLKASNAAGRYSIGNDSDQNSVYPGSVLASMVKNVDSTVCDLVGLAGKGTLHYGSTYVFGLSNGGVSLIQNKGIIPSAVATKLGTYEQEVTSGKVKVPCVNPYCAASGSVSAN